MTFWHIFGHGPTGGADAARLLDDLEKTGLGRQLLGFLKAQGYGVHVTDQFPAAHRTALGLASYGDKKIYIRPGLGAAETLRVFAHETRHVGQSVADATLPPALSDYNPVNAVVKTWLMEMDAEAFAAHFMFNHEQRAGGGVIAELMALESNDSRGQMYKAYMDGVIGTSGRNITGAMRNVFYAFLDAPAYINSYATRTIDNLDDTFIRYRREAYNGPLHVYFNKLGRADPSGTTGRERLFARAQAYSRVFGEFGAPDYLKGESPADLERGMTAGGRGWLTGRAGYMMTTVLSDYWSLESDSAPSGPFGQRLPKTVTGPTALQKLLHPATVPKELKLKY